MGVNNTSNCRQDGETPRKYDQWLLNRPMLWDPNPSDPLQSLWLGFFLFSHRYSQISCLPDFLNNTYLLPVYLPRSTRIVELELRVGVLLWERHQLQHAARLSSVSLYGREGFIEIVLKREKNIFSDEWWRPPECFCKDWDVEWDVPYCTRVGVRSCPYRHSSLFPTPTPPSSRISLQDYACVGRLDVQVDVDGTHLQLVVCECASCDPADPLTKSS